MNRLGAILVPMLAGFLLTVAAVSWRSGGWAWRGAQESPATAPLRVVERHSNLRIVPVHLTAASPATAARTPAIAHASVAAEAEPPAESYEPLPVPRVDPRSSVEQLEAPDRKFARGGRADED